MRRIEIDYDLIERVKDLLEDVEANGEITFKKYWKSLSTEDKIKDALTGANYYYDDDKDMVPIADFYEIRTMTFDNNAIYFVLNEHANIFLKRLDYSNSEIVKFERKEKLNKIKILSL